MFFPFCLDSLFFHRLVFIQMSHQIVSMGSQSFDFSIAAPSLSINFFVNFVHSKKLPVIRIIWQTTGKCMRAPNFQILEKKEGWPLKHTHKKHQVRRNRNYRAENLCRNWSGQSGDTQKIINPETQQLSRECKDFTDNPWQSRQNS